MEPLRDDPAQLMRQAVAMLWRNDRAARMAAAQLMARGYAIDEERRLAKMPEGQRTPQLVLLMTEQP